jgi:MFS family permease
LLATSLVHDVELRLVTGVAEALFFVGASTAAQDLAPDHRRGEAASYFSLSLFAGLGIGPWLGEWLLDLSGYRAVFGAAAGAAAFGALAALTVRDTRPVGEAPPGPVRLIHPAALRPGAILGCGIWGLAAFQPFVPLYALSIGMSGSRTVFLANTLTIFLFRSLGARLPDRLGPKLAARLSLACTPAGLAIMGLWAEPTGLYVGAVLLGVGQSMAFPALLTIAVNSAPASERGAVMGTFTAFFDLSFGLGNLALGEVAHAAGYNAVFLVAMGVASIGFAQMLFVPPRVRQPPTRAVENAAVAAPELPSE